MTGKTEIIRKPSPWPILIAALAWAIVCLILPMIQLWHYLAALAAGENIQNSRQNIKLEDSL